MEKLSYCGFWIRLLAHLIDGILLSVIVFVITIVSLVFNLVDFNTSFQTLFQKPLYILVLHIISTILVILIYTLFYSSHMQGTPGKYIVGIKIVDIAGNKISFLRAAARVFMFNPFSIVHIILETQSDTIQTEVNTAAYISSVGIIPLVIIILLPFIYWMISAFLVVFTKEKTALHDIICSTRVVKKSILSSDLVLKGTQ